MQTSAKIPVSLGITEYNLNNQEEQLSRKVKQMLALRWSWLVKTDRLTGKTLLLIHTFCPLPSLQGETSICSSWHQRLDKSEKCFSQMIFSFDRCLFSTEIKYGKSNMIYEYERKCYLIS